MGQIKRLSTLSFFFIFGLVGCHAQPTSHPNVLILAVENLGNDDISCSDEPTPGVQSGFDLLCKEAIQIESVKSPSRDSVESLGSFLFGLAPGQLKTSSHSDFVKAGLDGFAEQATEKKWSTAFFGSSPVFMRRSGLAQGFEFFEESAQVEAQRWGRGRNQVIQSFLKWQADQNPSPYYAVLTFSDLNFPWVRTLNLAGQEQPRTVEGQIDALSESWLGLFRKMREQKIWDKTWIIVIGLRSRGDGTNGSRMATLIKPPKGQEARAFDDQISSLNHFSNIFHQILYRNKIVDSSETDLKTFSENEVGVTSAESTSGGGPFRTETDFSFWITPSEVQKRSEAFRKLLPQNPGLKPWLLYELLDRHQTNEFIQLAARSGSLPAGPIDAAPYWDRLLSNRKTQILQDACLRMIDLKIFEGGGSKTCDSSALLALQDWLRQTEQSTDENRQREARSRALRAFHELKTIRRIHLVNRALGVPLDLPPEIGGEILRTEMALRLPELQSTKNWLDQSEQSLVDTTD